MSDLESMAADSLAECFVYTPEGARSLASELSKAKDPRAACRLLFEMHDASEDYSCSSWDECAAECIRSGRPSDPSLGGFFEVTRETIDTCAALARDAGGWWRWSDQRDDLVFDVIGGAL